MWRRTGGPSLPTSPPQVPVWRVLQQDVPSNAVKRTDEEITAKKDVATTCLTAGRHVEGEQVQGAPDAANHPGNPAV